MTYSPIDPLTRDTIEFRVEMPRFCVSCGRAMLKFRSPREYDTHTGERRVVEMVRCSAPALARWSGGHPEWEQERDGWRAVDDS